MENYFIEMNFFYRMFNMGVEVILQRHPPHIEYYFYTRTCTHTLHVQYESLLFFFKVGIINYCTFKGCFNPQFGKINLKKLLKKRK
jgi:hypothetical protein